MFRDRTDAGRQLAEMFRDRQLEEPVVLALPRGGVPVGFEVATALNAPLDLVIVRKLGAPYQPELAIGAVAEGSPPVVFLNNEFAEPSLLPVGYVTEQTAAELREIERRRTKYVGARERTPVVDRTAIVVDDGIATGATTRAALRAVRRMHPRRLILAIPVAPEHSIEALQHEADEIICIAQPSPFWAIGQFYQDFAQVSDAEVIALLRRADEHRNSARLA